MTDSTRGASAPRRKATLFCAACGHASPVDGDWIVHDEPMAASEHRYVYECPACGAVLTTRRSYADPCPA